MIYYTCKSNNRLTILKWLNILLLVIFIVKPVSPVTHSNKIGDTTNFTKLTFNKIVNHKKASIITDSAKLKLNLYLFPTPKIGDVIIGMDENNVDSSHWGNGSAEYKILLSAPYSPTLYTIVIRSNDKAENRLISLSRNGTASVLLDGEKIWSKRTENRTAKGFYIGTDCENIIITFVIRSPGIHILSFETGEQSLWALPQMELQAHPYPLFIKGIGYSPLRDCQYPGGKDEPSIKELEDDLFLLSHSCTAIRTYSSRTINKFVPGIAKRLGLSVFAGAWIDQNKVIDEAEIQELLNLADTVKLDGVIIGNEFSLRHPKSTDIQYLLQYIKRVKQSLKLKHIPIATAELENQIFTWENGKISIKPEYRPILDHLDIILIHIYPFWNGQNINGAAKYVVQKYKEIKTFIAQQYPGKNKKVIIGETGWPSKGEPRQKAIPSPDNQKKYLCEFLSLAEKEHVDYMYFDAFDELWKIEEPGGVGQHWGYCYSDRTAKYNFASVLVPSKLIKKTTLPPIPLKLSSKKVSAYKVYDEWPTFTSIKNNSFGSQYSSSYNLKSDFIPSGFMGLPDKISLCNCDRSFPHSGEMATKITFSFSGTNNFRGISWLANEKWNGKGINIYKKLNISTNAHIRLSFWARGEKGGESVLFKVGGSGSNYESIEVAVNSGLITLNNYWQNFKIDLTKKNLTSVVGGFCSVADKVNNSAVDKIVFFIDDIQYEIVH